MKRCPECGHLMIKVGILLHRWKCDNCPRVVAVEKKDEPILDDVLILSEAELVETER